MKQKWNALSRILWLWLVAMASGWLTGPLRADVTNLVTFNSITNFTGYLVASDANNPAPGYTREALRIRTDITYGRSGAGFVYDYRLEYRLKDASGAEVQLSLGGLASTNVVVLTETINLTVQATQQRTYTVSLRPAFQLSPSTTYTVELVMRKRVTGLAIYQSAGPVQNLGPNRYLHFPSLLSGDASLNVLAHVDAVTWGQEHAIRGADTVNAGFRINATTRLYRYDGFAGASGSDPVRTRLTVQLREEGTDAVVALKDSSFEFTNNVARYFGPQGQSPTSPSTNNLLRTLRIEPADGVQLDSVNKRYYVRVTIGVFDPIGAAFPIAGNAMESEDTRLLHFSGILRFGGVSTRILAHSGAHKPAAGAATLTTVATTLAPAVGGAVVEGQPGYTLGDGSVLPVRLRVDGVAEYTGGGLVTLQGPVVDEDEEGRIRYERRAVRLGSGGATGDLAVILPTGLGISADTNTRIQERDVLVTEVPLNAAFRPTAATMLADVTGWIAEETKPVWFEALSMEWNRAESRLTFGTKGNVRYVRGAELDFLQAAPVGPEAVFKRSNEGYWRFVEAVTSPSLVVNTGADGEALVTASVSFKPGLFVSHFPYGALVSWNTGGTASIVGDLMQPGTGSLSGSQSVLLRYRRHCGDEPCGGAIAEGLIQMAPVDSELRFTRDGGLHANGTFAEHTLQWGWIDQPGIQDFAHQVGGWTNGAFHMPGSFLRGDQTGQAVEQRPGVLMLTGVSNETSLPTERPGMGAYSQGLADYAGINLRVGAPAARQGESVLAGKPTGEYDLTARAKYYVRKAGVSGVHEAINGSFPAETVLYGYPVQFTTFGLSFLGSNPEGLPSRTAGSVSLVYPSNIEQEFEELQFNCLGALLSAEIPEGQDGLVKVLEYWQAPIVVGHFEFDRKDGDACDPGKGFVTLGVTAGAALVEVPLAGTLGFRPNGHLITLADDLLDPPFDSRFKVPANFVLRGPGNERYAGTFVSDAYLNSFKYAENSTGWLNLAAKLDVPFFEDLQVHIHTVAQADNNTAPVHLMGGWPNKGYGAADANFFTQNPFDTDNRGFPNGVTPDQYRAGLGDDDDQYRVRARRTWLEVVQFDYPLKWSSSTRAFTAFKPVEANLLVLKAEHQPKYLSAERAELVFGVQYEGLPVANLANFAFSELGGLQDAFTDYISTQVVDEGLGQLNSLLEAQVDRLLGPALDEIVDPLVDQLYTALNAQFALGSKSFNTPPSTVIQNHLLGGGGVPQPLIQRLDQLGAAVNNAASVAKRIDDGLAQVLAALGEIEKILAENPQGDRTIAAQLVGRLGSEVAAQIVGSLLDERINELLIKADPTLDEIHAVVSEIKGVIGQIRDRLGPAQEFAADLQQRIANAQGELQAALNKVVGDLDKHYAQYKPGLDNPFQVMSAADTKKLIRQRIEDRIFATALVKGIQTAIKHRVYDVDAAVREALDTVFAQINAVLRDAFADALAQLDGSINGFLGELGGLLGAGSIRGHAHIKGDSLTELRLDVKAEFKVTDNMKFEAYLLVRELNSDNTPAGCIPAGGKATEVTVGAKDVSLEWAYPGLRASLQAKCTLDTTKQFPLIGLGAGFQLTGELKFSGQFVIEELGAAMAFGVSENYFSASAALVFGKGYKGKGGIFFGRTCSLDAFFWDENLGSILGEPPFTGAYGYGEAWLPLNEIIGIKSTCFFTVSAGVGAGAGFFIEGPTFFGKMFFGLHGEVLCIVSITGEVELYGLVNPKGLTLKGVGTVAGEIGWCPICIAFKRSIGLSYVSGKWDLDF